MRLRCLGISTINHSLNMRFFVYFNDKYRGKTMGYWSVKTHEYNHIASANGIDPSSDGNKRDISPKDIYIAAGSLTEGPKKAAKMLFEIEMQSGKKKTDRMLSRMKKLPDADPDSIALIEKRLEELRKNPSPEAPLAYGEVEEYSDSYRVLLDPNYQIDATQLLINTRGETRKYGEIRVRFFESTSNPSSGILQYWIPDMALENIMGFRGKDGVIVKLKVEGGKVTEISSAVPKEILVAIFEIYGSPELPFTKEITKYLDLPRLTDAIRVRETLRRLEYEKKLDAVSKEEGRWLINPETGMLERTDLGRESMRDLPGANEVLQGEFGICKFEVSRTQYIQTFGATACVIVTLYDPVTKTGIVAHFDDTKDYMRSIGTMMFYLKKAGVDPKNLQARIIGGQRGLSEPIILRLYEALDLLNIPIVEKDILGRTSRSIALDVETGSVYNYKERTIVIDEEMQLRFLELMVSETIVFNQNENGFFLPRKKRFWK
jgi:chemotaxis receptor (MCP) glutamine deamidase CheD